METSLRYSKSLRIHAKEKLPFNSKTHLQLHGELDTGTRSPSYFCAMIRHLFPEASTGLGVGFHYDKRHKLRCHVRGKKEFPLITNSLVTFNVKGRCDFDQDFNQKNPIGAAEFAWNIMNFKEDQDVRIKVGYEMFNKMNVAKVLTNNMTALTVYREATAEPD
ncbi:unnamed protein product [Eruca vesicaria subsp. sativa]|uniref:Uncharacterized protein n=1 Tax=Eruca vesicaria subsp. sativa TaxID=29727 RepID=A0ABC8KXW5_ERUVS|nr:unnamed protein product [Eruca vesicaria subsp. sativa]